MSFDKLSIAELRNVAENEFAVALSDEEKKSKKLILAALTESGVKFSDYLANHPERAEEFGAVHETPSNVVTSADVTGQSPAPVEKPKQYLVKMTRENPLFEIGKYRFTDAHPFVLVDEPDLDRVLLSEEGFRQATPNEVQEYYS